ncbi:MAG: Clp protease ClpP [Peptostreptococcaceae bacterium]
MNRYYALNVMDKEATINIFGEISSWDSDEKTTSSYKLVQELNELEDIDVINVRINSYGGEVAEGLAIYNALKGHKATIKTYCDGFACSIASVIFMAGDERIMSDASLLMIHNAWTYANGDSNNLRKVASDLEIITKASSNAYLKEINVDEDTLKNMLDDETWIMPEEALSMNFATKIETYEKSSAISQNIKSQIINRFKNQDDFISQKLDLLIKLAKEQEEEEDELEEDVKPKKKKKKKEDDSSKNDDNDDETKEDDEEETDNPKKTNQKLSLLQKIRKNKEKN